MYYEPKSLSFEELITSLKNREPGFDAIAQFSFKQNDEMLDLKLEGVGIHPTPPSLTPDNPENPDKMLAIKAGNYYFMQLPVIEESRIKLELLPFIKGRKEGTVFIRIFKESLFEEVMQFIMPT